MLLEVDRVLSNVEMSMITRTSANEEAEEEAK